jgi:uncharacterized protein RhaS with RHS repeats
MATQLQIVNKVLRRLREGTVTSVSSSSYAKLIAMFVNEAKELIEDTNFWTANETAIDTSILSDGTLTYDLTGTSDRSFLIRYLGSDLPMAFDITDNGEGQLYDIPLKELNRVRDTWPGTIETSARPRAFAIQPDSDGRGYTLSLLYGSSTARTWRTYWYAPQAELAIDGSDDSTQIILPERMIYLKALWLAANERGEEMGEPGSILEIQANNALAAALELDMQVNKKGREELDITNLERLRAGGE